MGLSLSASHNHAHIMSDDLPILHGVQSPNGVFYRYVLINGEGHSSGTWKRVTAQGHSGSADSFKRVATLKPIRGMNWFSYHLRTLQVAIGCIWFGEFPSPDYSSCCKTRRSFCIWTLGRIPALARNPKRRGLELVGGLATGEILARTH